MEKKPLNYNVMFAWSITVMAMILTIFLEADKLAMMYEFLITMMKKMILLQ